MEAKVKRRRNRGPAVRILPTGETLASAQSDRILTQWANVSPDFKRILTMLTNERINALVHVPVALKTATEGTMLGIMLGWEACVACLAKLPAGPERGVPPQPEAEYPPDDTEKAFDTLT